MPDPKVPEVPQFGKAEYATRPNGATCALCKQPLGSTYYRVEGRSSCEPCARKLKAAMPSDTPSAFTRAVLAGIGGAIVGFIAYSAFTVTTGIEIGFLSLAVGYLVGKAMKLGSQGAGGRRYQVAAVALTYAAVSLSAIPVALYQANGNRGALSPTSQSSRSPARASTDRPEANDQPSLLLSLGALAAIGLASPFLELQNPVNGAIGLFILFVGMRVAWRMTAGPPYGAVLGPFTNQPLGSADQAPTTGT